jgi:hypothetical protein
MADAEKYRYATSAPDVVSNAVHVINLAGGLDVPDRRAGLQMPGLHC